MTNRIKRFLHWWLITGEITDDKVKEAETFAEKVNQRDVSPSGVTLSPLYRDHEAEVQDTRNVIIFSVDEILEAE